MKIFMLLLRDLLRLPTSLILAVQPSCLEIRLAAAFYPEPVQGDKHELLHNKDWNFDHS